MPLTPFRFLLVPAVALLTHCASPNSSDARMDRVDANRDVYETWPLTVKEAVLEGRVTRGMDPVMVQVALGRPDEQVDGNNGDVVWVYYQGKSYEVYQQPQQRGLFPHIPSPTRDPYPVPMPTRTGSMRGQVPVVHDPIPPPMPTVVRDTRYDIEIVFRDGLVVAGDGVR